MADKQDMLRIKRVILKDKKVVRLEKAFSELADYNLPFRDMYEEIERIHMTRKTRHLDKSSSTFVQDIMDGMINDQSSRSRLTEILMSCVHAGRNLSSTLETLEGYLSIEYADQLRSIRTKGERVSFLRHHVLSKYHKYIDRVDRIKEAADLVMTDIDKAGFVYRNIIESVKLAAGRREVM